MEDQPNWSGRTSRDPAAEPIGIPKSTSDPNATPVRIPAEGTQGDALAAAMASESASAEASETGVGTVGPERAEGLADPTPVQPAEFGNLSPEDQAARKSSNIDLLLDVNLPISIELGRTRMSIHDILELGSGSIVELDKLAGEPVDILVNNKPLAKGEVVVLDENFGVRITSLVSPRERLERLRMG